MIGPFLTLSLARGEGMVEDLPCPAAGHNDKENTISFGILVFDDEPDVADLFRQRFRRETRQGLYVLYFPFPAEEALARLVMTVAAYGDEERRRRQRIRRTSSSASGWI
jgi:hypothetical protein